MSVTTFTDSTGTWFAEVTAPNTAEHAREAVLDELRQRVSNLAESDMRLLLVYVDSEGHHVYREHWDD